FEDKLNALWRQPLVQRLFDKERRLIERQHTGKSETKCLDWTRLCALESWTISDPAKFATCAVAEDKTQEESCRREDPCKTQP
ncbi:unnamed protein product, partial [Amoebophrya sp. A25]